MIIYQEIYLGHCAFNDEFHDHVHTSINRLGIGCCIRSSEIFVACRGARGALSGEIPHRLFIIVIVLAVGVV